MEFIGDPAGAIRAAYTTSWVCSLASRQPASSVWQTRNFHWICWHGTRGRAPSVRGLVLARLPFWLFALDTLLPPLWKLATTYAPAIYAWQALLAKL